MVRWKTTQTNTSDDDDSDKEGLLGCWRWLK